MYVVTKVVAGPELNLVFILFTAFEWKEARNYRPSQGKKVRSEICGPKVRLFLKSTGGIWMDRDRLDGLDCIVP